MGPNEERVRKHGGPKWLRRIAAMLDGDAAAGVIGEDQATCLMLVAASWEPSPEVIEALEADDGDGNP